MTDDDKQLMPIEMTPSGMIALALQSGVSPTDMTALYNLYERDQASKARQAFNAAVAAFKADPPEILKTHKVDFANKSGGRTTYKHAELDRIVDAITPVLCRHGLTMRWQIDQSDITMPRVTCVLSHAAGHSESVPMAGPADNTGGKNSIQAIASTVTYLQRYTLMSILGLAAKGTDDDGRMTGSASNKITDEQVMQIDAFINDNELDKVAIHEYLQAKGYEEFADLPASQYKEFMGTLQRAAKRKQGAAG